MGHSLTLTFPTHISFQTFYEVVDRSRSRARARDRAIRGHSLTNAPPLAFVSRATTASHRGIQLLSRIRAGGSFESRFELFVTRSNGLFRRERSFEETRAKRFARYTPKISVVYRSPTFWTKLACRKIPLRSGISQWNGRKR